MIAAYGALVLATLAQLAVPQLVQNMLDAVTQGVSARQYPKRRSAADQRGAADRAVRGHSRHLLVRPGVYV